MSRFDNEIRVRPSVLDRLIDYEPEYSREAPASRVKNLRILKVQEPPKVATRSATRAPSDSVPGCDRSRATGVRSAMRLRILRSRSLSSSSVLRRKRSER